MNDQGTEVCFQSDVWAYGVTLWEIFTLGDRPLAGYNSSLEILAFLEGGGRLKEPQLCSHM